MSKAIVIRDTAAYALSSERIEHDLATLVTVVDTLEYRDRAKAIADYQMARTNHIAQRNHITRCVLRIEIHLGGLLKEQPKAKGRLLRGDTMSPREDAATLADLGISKKESERFQELAELSPEDLEEVERSATAADKRLTKTAVKKVAKKRKAEKEKDGARARGKKAKAPPTARLIVSAVDHLINHVEESSVDVIITDPPYPREFLPVYAQLAATASHVLKPGGSCVVMIGQSYLPEIVAALSKHLRYHWTLAYLTPGGQAVQLWDREVNTFWKPLLWFTKGDYAGGWIGDVVKSDVNDNDKRFHGWGQSESGMRGIVERLSKPGDTILDPFCGGGTTGVVAVALERRFIGSDISQDSIDLTRGRLAP